jgi:hypothetical protein
MTHVVALPVIGDRAWTPAPRPRSIPMRWLSWAEVIEGLKTNVLTAELAASRPKTRGDCEGSPRPCPWAGCRYHLAVDISDNGWLKVNFPGLKVWEMPETCALDVADRGGLTLEALGAALNISLEGARQVEIDVLAELRAKIGDEELEALLARDDELDDDRRQEPEPAAPSVAMSEPDPGAGGDLGEE